MITFRDMTVADIPAGLSLCRSAGWNQLENDWNVFLSLSKYGNRVAVNDDGKIVGTVTTITYEDRFSWIGMVLVDPAMKRQGIGTQLLRESLELLANQETIKLDATPAGREVYLKLGFEDEYVLSRMMSTQKVSLKNSSPGKKGSFFSIADTDKKVFGASRKDLLQLYHEAFPEFCFIKNSSNYCFGRRGYNFTQIGPVVADSAEQAIELTTAALNNIEGAVVLDVMENSAFSGWLNSIGFVEQRKLIRMYRGKNNFPGIPAKQFAILGPEFG
ncbi:MAG: GNAT family N-acetyltransferase [Chitinophagaceae bacterium]|nr:GNAT family N-acetyltransferase [Chitinophagaceae bacterium]